MAKHRVQLFNQSRGVEVDTSATEGAVVGVNLRWPDGTMVQLQPPSQTDPSPPQSVVYWRTIEEVPQNVRALAAQTGAGIYVLTGPGSSTTRALQPAPGETEVANGNGVDGDPVVGLADVAPEEGGLLRRVQFDSKGRRSHEGDATTDNLAEGNDNLYFTEDRVIDILEAVGAVIPSRPPDDGEILEFDDDAEAWIPTLHPRKIFIDGGNF